MPGENIIGRCNSTHDSQVFNRVTIGVSVEVSEVLEAIFTPDDPEFDPTTIVRETTVSGAGSQSYDQMTFKEELVPDFFHLTRGCCCKCRWIIDPTTFDPSIDATRTVTVTVNGEADTTIADAAVAPSVVFAGSTRECRSAGDAPSDTPRHFVIFPTIPVNPDAFPGAPDFEWPLDIDGGTAGPDENAGIPTTVLSDPINPCAPGIYVIVMTSSITVSDSYYDSGAGETVNRTYTASFTYTVTITIEKV